MHMDDIKILAKNEKELESIIQSTKIFCQNVGVEFGIEKYTILTKKMKKKKSLQRE